MNFKVHPGYHRELEITKLLRRTFSEKSLDEKIDDYKQKFSGDESIVTSMFRDLKKITDDFNAFVIKNDYRYELFFEPMENSLLSLGEMIVFLRFPASERKVELPHDIANIIVISYLFGEDNNIMDDYVRLGYANKDIVRREIASSNLGNRDKFKLLYLLDDFDEAIAEFADYISIYYNFMNEHHVLFNKLIVRIIDKFKHASGEKFIEFMKNNMSIKKMLNKDYLVMASVVPYHCVDYTYYDFAEAETPIIQIGFLYFELAQMMKKHQNNEDRFLKAAKIVSDPSKFEILKICLDKPVYGQEVAEKMNLASSMVSHHMQQLVAMNYVIANFEEKKIYYKTNVEAILADLELLKEVLA